MIMPTCAKCNRELKPIRNDVVLVHFTDNDRTKGIDAYRRGDLCECPECHCQVVIGLGNGYDLGEQKLGYLIKDEKEFLKNEFVIEVKR